MCPQQLIVHSSSLPLQLSSVKLTHCLQQQHFVAGIQVGVFHVRVVWVGYIVDGCVLCVFLTFYCLIHERHTAEMPVSGSADYCVLTFMVPMVSHSTLFPYLSCSALSQTFTDSRRQRNEEISQSNCLHNCCCYCCLLCLFTILQVSLLEKYFPLATELHDITQCCLKVK